MKKSILLFSFVFISFSITISSQNKDTLFIANSDKLLLKKWKDPTKSEFSYIVKGSGNDGLVYLLEKEKYTDLKHQKIICFRNLIEDSNSYYKRNKIDDWKLAEYLGKFVIFLVNGNKYIKVQVVHEIE